MGDIFIVGNEKLSPFAENANHYNDGPSQCHEKDSSKKCVTYENELNWMYQFVRRRERNKNRQRHTSHNLLQSKKDVEYKKHWSIL